MATYFNTVANPNMQTTASLRETIGDIRDAFSACGFTRTTQSGSVDDLSTLTPRTSVGMVTYDVFAFTDALQAVSPLFIKIEYYVNGVSLPTTSQIGLFAQMGSSIDNSGSFLSINTLTALGNTHGSSTTIVSGSTIHANGDGSYMTLCVFPQMDSAQFLVFERLYDINGQPTGSGFHMLGTDARTGASKTIYSQMALTGQAPSVRESVWLPNSRSSRAPALYDGRLVLGLMYPFYGKPYNPSPNILIGTSTDFPNTLQSIKYTMYGTERSYIALGSIFNQTNSRIYSDSRFLMRYS